MPLSDEERQRIYEEEKAREEARERLGRERSEGRPKLTKNINDKVLFGVASGLAKHFDVDPLLVRIGFVVLSLADGLGLLMYVALAIILPPRSSLGPNQVGMMAIAIVLVVILGVVTSIVGLLRFLF